MKEKEKSFLSIVSIINKKRELSVDMEVFKYCKCVIMRNLVQVRNECSLRLMDTRVRALQRRDYDTADNLANFGVAKDATPSEVLLSVGFATLHLRLRIILPLRGFLSFSTLNSHKKLKNKSYEKFNYFLMCSGIFFTFLF